MVKITCAAYGCGYFWHGNRIAGQDVDMMLCNWCYDAGREVIPDKTQRGLPRYSPMHNSWRRSASVGRPRAVRPPDPKAGGNGNRKVEFKRQIATLDQAELKTKLEECDRSIIALGELPMLADKKGELEDKREIIIAKLSPDAAAEAQKDLPPSTSKREAQLREISGSIKALSEVGGDLNKPIIDALREQQSTLRKAIDETKSSEEQLKIQQDALVKHQDKEIKKQGTVLNKEKELKEARDGLRVVQEQIKECKNRIAVLSATVKREPDDDLQLTPNRVFEHCKSWTGAQQVEHAEKLFRAAVSHGSITVDGALGVIASHGVAREKQKASLLIQFEEENARLRQSHDRLEAALREYKAANPSEFLMSPKRGARSEDEAAYARATSIVGKPSSLPGMHSVEDDEEVLTLSDALETQREVRTKELRSMQLFNSDGEVLDQQAIQRMLVKTNDQVLQHLRYPDGIVPPRDEIEILCNIYLFANALQPGTESSVRTRATVGSVASSISGLPETHPAAHMSGVQADIVDLDGEDSVPVEAAAAGIPNSKSPIRPTEDDKEVFQFGNQPPDPGDQTMPVKSAFRTSRSASRNQTVDVVDEDGDSRKVIVAGKIRDADPQKVAEAGNSLRTTNTVTQRNAAKEALLKERRSSEEGEAQEEVTPEPSGSDQVISQTQAVDFNGNIVYKETGEAVSIEDLGRVLRNPPELISMYIFKKEGQPFTLEEIQSWQEAQGIQASEMVAHGQSMDVAERQGLDNGRAATLNHRSEPMGA